jgi:hypothetical protein
LSQGYLTTRLLIRYLLISLLGFCKLKIQSYFHYYLCTQIVDQLCLYASHRTVFAFKVVDKILTGDSLKSKESLLIAFYLDWRISTLMCNLDAIQQLDQVSLLDLVAEWICHFSCFYFSGPFLDRKGRYLNIMWFMQSLSNFWLKYYNYNSLWGLLFL